LNLISTEMKILPLHNISLTAIINFGHRGS